MEQPAVDFTSLVSRTFLDRADIADDEVELGSLCQQLLHLPVRNGGVGLPHAASTRKLAWLGSFAAAAETMTSDPRFSSRVCGSAHVQEAVTAALKQAREQQQRLSEAGGASAALTPEAPTVLSTLEFYGKPPALSEDDNPNQPLTAHKLQRKPTSLFSAK